MKVLKDSEGNVIDVGDKVAYLRIHSKVTSGIIDSRTPQKIRIYDKLLEPSNVLLIKKKN